MCFANAASEPRVRVLQVVQRKHSRWQQIIKSAMLFCLHAVWRQSDTSGTSQQVSVTSSSQHPRGPPSAQNLRHRQQAHALLASAAPATAVGRRGTRAGFATHVELACDPFLDDYHEATEMNQGIQAAVTANLKQLGLLDEGATVEVDAMAFGRELVLALCAAKQRGELDMPVDQATAQSAAEESAGAAVVHNAASAPASPLAAVQCDAATSVPAAVNRNDPATVPAQSSNQPARSKLPPQAATSDTKHGADQVHA